MTYHFDFCSDSAKRRPASAITSLKLTYGDKMRKKTLTNHTTSPEYRRPTDYFAKIVKAQMQTLQQSYPMSQCRNHTKNTRHQQFAITHSVQIVRSNTAQKWEAIKGEVTMLREQMMRWMLQILSSWPAFVRSGSAITVKPRTLASSFCMRFFFFPPPAAPADAALFG